MVQAQKAEEGPSYCLRCLPWSWPLVVVDKVPRTSFHQMAVKASACPAAGEGCGALARAWQVENSKTDSVPF